MDNVYAILEPSKPRCWETNSDRQIGRRPFQETYRYVASTGGGFAATVTPTDDVRNAIVNIRGDVVAEVDNAGVTQAGPVDEFGEPEDGILPQGRRYGFQGSHQREALTESGTVAMGVRLYVPRIGRFLQVDPVLGGTEGAYEYPSDPVNKSDLSGELTIGRLQLSAHTAREVKKGSKVFRRRCSAGRNHWRVWVHW